VATSAPVGSGSSTGSRRRPHWRARQALLANADTRAFGHGRQVEQHQLQVRRPRGHLHQERAFAAAHVQQAAVVLQRVGTSRISSATRGCDADISAL
jgi:hypothetical protein